METKKSFTEILGRAISTFRSSFGGIFLTYCFALPVLAVMQFIFSRIMPTQSKPTPSTAMLILAFTFLIPYFYSLILFQTWQLLVIKSNIFTGVSNLLDAFKKSLLKSLQICLVLIVLIPIFTFLAFNFAKGFPSCVKLMPLFTIPLMPFTMLFIGITLQDGKFINVLINSLGISLTHYFRILGYMLLLMLVSFVVFFLLSALFVILKFLGPLTFVLIALISFLLYITVYPFCYCFLEELYFDLVMVDDEKPLEDMTELSESYPDIIDVNQTQEPSPEEPLKQEPLPQDGNIQAEQKPHKDEIPEGLQQLGGNYEDKK